MINIKDFSKIDIRIGTIIKAEFLDKAITPAYHLEIDFGKLGIKHSSAQITGRYSVDELIGRQIVAIVNFPSKQIAGVKSEVLVMGANDDNENVILIEPQKNLSNSAKVG